MSATSSSMLNKVASIDEPAPPSSSSPSSPLLVVEHLYKSFSGSGADRVEVLRGVSFEVARGEMLAVVGASGAGKSTLLQVLGGLDSVDCGTARLNDFCITEGRAGELTRFRLDNVGFVFQSHHLLPGLTALENVALPLLVARRSRQVAFAEAEQMLIRVKLAGRLSHRPAKLSGGEAQRVAIARALVNHPRLVLADEPTGNLDQAINQEIGEMLRELTIERRAATIIATHNKGLADLCHRTLQLVDGRAHVI